MAKRVVQWLGLSVVVAGMLHAEELKLETVEVEESGTVTLVKDVAGEEVRSADLAEALYKLDPDVQIVRRSGIANDITLRGMRKDNINVLIDGGKLYGGCPNRMDPPISHVLSNNVDDIVLKEGPYDVQHFGTLTGLVEINTLKPSKEFHGEIDLNAGSWNYTKLGARFSGGTDRVRLMVGASTESSGQYEDGDGRTLAEQVEDYAATVSPTNPKYSKIQGQRYAPQYFDMNAYEKKTGMVKLYADVTDHQELQLSYTENHSNDVMYPNTPMDALKDLSRLFNAKYTMHDLGEWSKRLTFEFYNSWVYHPMGTYFRRSANNPRTGVVENVMHSRIYGGTVKNSFDLYEGTVTAGIDSSRRTWRGYYTWQDGNEWVLPGRDGQSIDHSKSDNIGIFLQYTKKMGEWDIDTGLRYDGSKVNSDDPGVEQNKYYATSGYLFATYHIDDSTRMFGGAGASARIPDGKELYFTTNPGMGGIMKGNPDLKQVKNYQIDVGVEKEFDNTLVRFKGFYSVLKDFIFYNATKQAGTYIMNGQIQKIFGKYENQDAKLYGISLDGTYMLSDSLYFDGGFAYLRGKKDDPLSGQTDRDMPNITPLKCNVGANWEFDETGSMRLSMVAASGWNNYDGGNGEQELGGYAVFNFRIKKDFLDRYELTLGVDNILDKTYAVTNTYADMTLVTGGTPMLLNEPGRYIYGNFTWHF